MMLKAIKTQRLARPSFSPVLRLTLLKGAATNITRVTAAKAINDGWLTNAFHPPSSRIAIANCIDPAMRLLKNILAGVIGLGMTRDSSGNHGSRKAERREKRCARGGRKVEPRVGVEPTTCRLRIGCSTTELPRLCRKRRRAAHED